MTDSNTKMSVVMTVYNGEAFLTEAVRSILEQSFQDYEFVIVDDGSTDRSAEIIRNHRDERIRFFPLNHIGRAAALNYAIAQTTSPLVAIMDADDIALPQRLQVEFDVLSKDDAIDVVSSSYIIINAQGKVIREKYLPVTHQAIVDLMPVQCSMCFPASVIRKRIILNAGMFDERSTVSEDYEFWLKILGRAKFSNVPMSLIKYRVSQNSTSVKFKKSQFQRSYQLGSQYLEERLRTQQDRESRALIILQLGKREYYSGTMASARRYFAKLLWSKSLMRFAWRYYLSSLLGDRFFSFLRKSGVADRLGRLFRRRSMKHDYFMP